MSNHASPSARGRKTLKAIALLFGVYTLIVSGATIAVGYVVGFLLRPFFAGYEYGNEHHAALIDKLKKHL